MGLLKCESDKYKGWTGVFIWEDSSKWLSRRENWIGWYLFVALKYWFTYLNDNFSDHMMCQALCEANTMVNDRHLFSCVTSPVCHPYFSELGHQSVYLNTWCRESAGNGPCRHYYTSLLWVESSPSEDPSLLCHCSCVLFAHPPSLPSLVLAKWIPDHP